MMTDLYVQHVQQYNVPLVYPTCTEVDTKSPAHALVIALTLISESGPKIV